MSTQVDNSMFEPMPIAADIQDGDIMEELNGNIEPSFKQSVVNGPTRTGRIIRKAKRFTKSSPIKEENVNGGVTYIVNQTTTRAPFSKNSRKSRNARGRGLPKKGGAGGKGVWGKPGSELYEGFECGDNHDPNYDSDLQDNYVVQKVEPVMTSVELSKVVEPIISEYLEHGDWKEVAESLEEYNMGNNKYCIPEAAISIAMERHDSQREMTSRLISDLHGRVISQGDVAKAFDNLLDSLSDLTLDTPEAPKVLGQFIARAVADDCLSPRFVSSYKGNVKCPITREALKKSEVLLSVNHTMAMLDNVWGEGGGNRPVKYLINKMVSLLKEYINSGDITEATRCLQELEVPHFYHELVYEAALLAIEESTDVAADMIVQLLKSLTATVVITSDQFSKGVGRIFDDMPDICLDVPAAYAMLERLGNKLHAEGILSDRLFREMPIRGRKRFVSEGDGGKVKEDQPLH